VGAGALPVDAHRRRPPIPIAPVDEGARAAALARGAGEARAWLAAVTGGVAEPGVRVVSTEDVEVLRTTLTPRGDGSILTIGEVALAVDTGRELAARAAADGVHVLVATIPGDGSDASARGLADALATPGDHGPLGALRRQGDAPIAVLCGVALGCGEHGLGCVPAGVPALAGAAVAAGIEPDLRARLLAAGVPADDALVARLGVGLAPGADAAAVTAALAATPPAPAPRTARPPAPR
jgi:nicotinate-nucleotide--dimethylbenzimidazole phosphoribosyltransferase